jgi:hypothetical protein
MIKVGNMVQSKYVLSSGKEGNLGLVMEMRNTVNHGGEVGAVVHVYYPKTRTFGWVVAKDMKVVA